MTSRSMHRANERKRAKQAKRAKVSAATAGLMAIGTGAPLGAMVLYAAPAEAAGFSVTNTADAGPGSLRAAVEQANAADGADVITFDAVVSGTIALTSGEIEITDDLTIDGPGSGTLSVDAGGDSRVFNVISTRECVPDGGFYYGYPTYDCTSDGPVEAVVISGLTLEDAAAPSTTYDYYGYTYTIEENGGAVYANTFFYGSDGYYDAQRSALVIDDVTITDSQAASGAAIYVRNATQVTMTDSTFRDNDSSRGSGGAVRTRSTRGPVTVSGSQFDGNSARFNGGGLETSSTSGDVTVTDTTFTDNVASSGGALSVARTFGNALVQDAVISGNSASDGSGGGLMLYGLYLYSGESNTAELVVTDTEISGNTAYADGGGVALSGPYSSVLRNSTSFTSTTISGNTAVGTPRSYGGGVYIPPVSRFGDLEQTFTSTTIADNTASRGGGIVAGDGTKVLQNTIVADNAPKDLTLTTTYADPFELDFTLIENPARESTAEVTVGSSIIGADPELGPLTDNGGGVRTMAPAVSSPVVDAGKAFGLASDATGGPRTVDIAAILNAAGSDATDMGDVEVPASAAVLVANTTAPSIAGSPVVGSTLTAAGGVWNPADVTLTYQWLRGGSPIAGATDSTYTVVAGDVGSTISVRVTASRTGFVAAVADSSPTAAVTQPPVSNTAAPTISGTPRVGATLVASGGTWNPADVSLAFQWLRGGTPVAGATSTTYALTAADAGSGISVRVTATRAGFTPQEAVSVTTALVAKGTLVAPAPTISGTPKVKKKLKAVAGATSPSGAGTSYQWLRNGKVIAKATKSTYKVTKKDKGKKLSVRVVRTLPGYGDDTQTSASVTVPKKKK